MQVCLLSRYRLSSCIPKITRACSCCALQTAVERAFSCSSLETQICVNNLRNWRSMDPSTSREISLTVRWLWGLSSWLSNSDSTVSTFSSVCALRRLPLPGRLPTVLNFTSSPLMLVFVQSLFRNSVINCRYELYIRTDFKSLSSLLNGVKVGAYAW